MYELEAPILQHSSIKTSIDCLFLYLSLSLSSFISLHPLASAFMGVTNSPLTFPFSHFNARRVPSAGVHTQAAHPNTLKSIPSQVDDDPLHQFHAADIPRSRRWDWNIWAEDAVKIFQSWQGRFLTSWSCSLKIPIVNVFAWA